MATGERADGCAFKAALPSVLAVRNSLVPETCCLRHTIHVRPSQIRQLFPSILSIGGNELVVSILPDKT